MSTLWAIFPYNSISFDLVRNSLSVVIIDLICAKPYFSFSLPSGVYVITGGVYVITGNFLELIGLCLTTGKFPLGFYIF